MPKIGLAIAFSSLVFATAWLEIGGFETDGLWILVVIWAILGRFNGEGEK